MARGQEEKLRVEDSIDVNSEANKVRVIASRERANQKMSGRIAKRTIKKHDAVSHKENN